MESTATCWRSSKIGPIALSLQSILRLMVRQRRFTTRLLWQSRPALMRSLLHLVEPTSLNLLILIWLIPYIGHLIYLMDTLSTILTLARSAVGVLRPSTQSPCPARTHQATLGLTPMVGATVMLIRSTVTGALSSTLWKPITLPGPLLPILATRQPVLATTLTVTNRGSALKTKRTIQKYRMAMAASIQSTLSRSSMPKLSS